MYTGLKGEKQSHEASGHGASGSHSQGGFAAVGQHLQDFCRASFPQAMDKGEEATGRCGLGQIRWFQILLHILPNRHQLQTKVEKSTKIMSMTVTS